MADAKITQLTELTAPAAGDLLAIVDDPGGSPATKKITLTNFYGSAPALSVRIGDTANTFMTVGLTINQGANDDEIIALKSSDVATPFTVSADADTYGVFKKVEATSGGMQVEGRKDADGANSGAVLVKGLLGEAANTAKSTVGYGVVRLSSAITDGGTGATTVGADGNIVSIENNTTVVAIFDTEGTLHQGFGGDADYDLIQVNVTGAPKLYWDESENRFSANVGMVVTSGFMGYGTPTELTISGGIVTATKSRHTIDTQSDDAADDLDTINGGSEGDLLIISAADSDRTVTAKDGTGNLSLAGDFAMDHNSDRLMLVKGAVNWVEVSRSDNT